MDQYSNQKGQKGAVMAGVMGMWLAKVVLDGVDTGTVPRCRVERSLFFGR